MSEPLNDRHPPPHGRSTWRPLAANSFISQTGQLTSSSAWPAPALTEREAEPNRSLLPPRCSLYWASLSNCPSTAALNSNRYHFDVRPNPDEPVQTSSPPTSGAEDGASSSSSSKPRYHWLCIDQELPYLSFAADFGPRASPATLSAARPLRRPLTLPRATISRSLQSISPWSTSSAFISTGSSTCGPPPLRLRSGSTG